MIGHIIKDKGKNEEQDFQKGKYLLSPPSVPRRKVVKFCWKSLVSLFVLFP